ncbi:MAG TPA: RNA-binding domain-containing protein [Jatrophihabitans sp.]|nr:RNA-binding domain-containing protein [Jatrophihabitans sp.]
MDEQALRRRWVPTDEAGLREAFERGVFEERNWCELKRELGDTKSANTDLAKNLASLAVDGGSFIVGLDERAPDGNPLHPVPLNRLCERIEQIAHTRIHPPLQVECTPLQSDAARELGYVIVNVPASPLAPHQVDGVYYGRGDKMRRRLSDAEIERLFQRRAQWAAGAEADLRQFMQVHNPESVGASPQLFLVARPAAAWPEMGRPMVGEVGWEQRLDELRQAVASDVAFRSALDRMFPGMAYPSVVPQMRNVLKTPAGARMTLREPQTPIGSREWDVDLDIGERGLVSLWCAMISLADRSFNGITSTGILIDYVAMLVHEFLVTVALLSDRLRYRSSWDLGLGMTRLFGTRPIASVSTLRATTVGAVSPAYEARELLQTTRADVIELEKQPGMVAERLLGLFARATSTENFLAPLLSAPPSVGG